MENIEELINDTPIKADIDDLRLELWLRRRNANEIMWTTKSGEKIPISQMTEKHLINAIALAERIENRITQLLELEGAWVDMC